MVALPWARLSPLAIPYIKWLRRKGSLIAYLCLPQARADDRHGSIGTQLEDGRSMAEREGWAVVGEYQDEGFSAYKGNRGPGLEDAKRHAAETAAEHGECMLVVQHSDRLARGAGDAPGAADHLGEVFFWAKRHRIRLRSVQDDSNLEDVIRAVLIGERNTEDSRRKSEAVRSGKRRQFERGERLGGPVPDGYLLKDALDSEGRAVKRYELDPERAPIVSRIFELADSGMAPGAIARLLNSEGLRTKSDRSWTRRRVQDTLTNVFYAGLVERKRGAGDVAQGRHPALVEADMLHRIRAQFVGQGAQGARQARRSRPSDSPLRALEAHHLRPLRRLDVCGHQSVRPQGRDQAALLRLRERP
jgi:DNA invertase Pin-like site-specific DNA recombinase